MHISACALVWHSFQSPFAAYVDVSNERVCMSSDRIYAGILCACEIFGVWSFLNVSSKTLEKRKVFGCTFKCMFEKAKAGSKVLCNLACTCVCLFVCMHADTQSQNTGLTS